MKYEKGFYCHEIVFRDSRYFANVYYFDGEKLELCSNKGEWLASNLDSFDELELFSFKYGHGMELSYLGV